MADFLDVTIMTNYVREIPPENNKLMNQKMRILASAFESGERVLQVGSTDVKLVDNVTNFYLISDKPITITLSDGTVLDKMTQFVYGGENPVSVTVSNQTDQAKIVYSAGLRSR